MAASIGNLSNGTSVTSPLARTAAACLLAWSRIRSAAARRVFLGMAEPPFLAICRFLDYTDNVEFVFTEILWFPKNSLHSLTGNLPHASRCTGARALEWDGSRRSVRFFPRFRTVAARAGRWNLPAVYGLFPRLAERRGNMGNQLSGGEQQMLAIARSLTHLKKAG